MIPGQMRKHCALTGQQGTDLRIAASSEVAASAARTGKQLAVCRPIAELEGLCDDVTGVENSDVTSFQTRWKSTI